MYFNPKLGMQGNLEKTLRENQLCSNEIFNERNERKQSDCENREAVEQMLTDQMLDMISAQQDITELQLKILGG